jgi:hypothetical protein
MSLASRHKTEGRRAPGLAAGIRCAVENQVWVGGSSARQQALALARNGLVYGKRGRSGRGGLEVHPALVRPGGLWAGGKRGSASRDCHHIGAREPHGYHKEGAQLLPGVAS